MAKRRKQKVVVEITTDKPLTEKQAQHAVRILLERGTAKPKPIWPHIDATYVDKLQTKEFERVARAERFKAVSEFVQSAAR